MSSGFLVVLPPELNESTGVLYAGVGRVPVYPPKEPAEADAMDEYVFGDVKDSRTNLIVELSVATKLHAALTASGRAFEIIYCRTSVDEPSPFDRGSARAEWLGWDVSGFEGYWSILDDFTPSPWGMAYRQYLNAKGLFESRILSLEYLHQYRLHDEPDWDSGLQPIEVFGISP